MTRLAANLLVLLALTGVVSGNLLRPCDCTPDEETGTRALCQLRQTEVHSLPSCCGGCPQKVPGDAPGGEDSDGDEGCTLCCKPRPPLTEASSASGIDDGRTVVVAVCADVRTSRPAPLRAIARPLPDERRSSDHRLLSPEGLSVFLI